MQTPPGTLSNPAPVWRLRGAFSAAIGVACCFLAARRSSTTHWSQACHSFLLGLGTCFLTAGLAFLFFSLPSYRGHMPDRLRPLPFFVPCPDTGCWLRQWEASLRAMQRGSTVSFKPSAARWRAFREAQYGLHGRSTRSALHWLGLCEAAVGTAAALLGLCFGAFNAWVFCISRRARWLCSHESIMPFALTMLAPFAASLPVYARLCWLWLCFWNAREEEPPSIAVHRGAKKDAGVPTLLFRHLLVRVNAEAAVLQEDDGPVLGLDVHGVDGIFETIARVLPRGLHRVHVPLDADFDAGTLSRSGFTLLQEARD